MIRAGQIFVIGDSHVGLTEGSEKAIVAWVDRLVALQPRALYLNGDLFHYFIADSKFYTKSVENVFARFRELRDSGVAVHYVEGNRDFYLRGSFAEASVSDVAEEYVIKAGERTYLIEHGDLINDRDYPYRFFRFVSKNRLSKFALKFVPRSIAKKFVDGVEARLSQSNFKHKSRLPLEHMHRYAETRRDDGITDIVFGHFHEKVVMPGDPSVMILPPWFETGEAMVIDPSSGEFEWVVV